MDDSKIKSYCIWARTELLSEVENRMQRYGIVEEGAAPADADTVGGFALSVQEKEQRKQLLQLQNSLGHDALKNRVAYTWFNRLIAIRFMELHDYLPCGMHVLSDADGTGFKPEVVKRALEVEIAGANPDKVVRLMQSGEDEPVFRCLLLAQCDELEAFLPQVFEPVDRAMELLLPSNLLREGSVVGRLVTDIPVNDWLEQVQILGWMYQYYNSEVKDDFFKSKRKATAKDIAPATQLFTPEWIVRYMVENSLGRLWMLNFPESNLAENWEYYIQPDAEHEDFVHISGPEDISLCDPACGSGHILVYAFDLLFQMYEWCGYRERDIPQLILENNLTGMEIDPRAAQIACLALTMCAREHDRRFFKREVRADINVIVPTVFDEGELPEGAALLQQPQLLEALAHLDEIGSLLNPTEDELSALDSDAQRFAGEQGQASLFGNKVAEKLNDAKKTCETLARKFTCVVANPPYMGSSSFSPFMSKWIKKHYLDVKSDLCACFIERSFGLVQEHGYSALVTMQSWMFLGSFEKMRTRLIDQHSIVSMAHIGARGFDSIGGEVVSTAAAVFTVGQPDVEGAYLRLVDPIGEAAKMAAAKEAIANPNCGYFYRRNAKTFTQIPGTPIAYWASDAHMDAFARFGQIRHFAYGCNGMTTGENARFLRLWQEVSWSDVSLHSRSYEEAIESGCRWFPYNKGGDFRKWYGNEDWLINWANDGEEARAYGHLVPRSRSYMYKPEITWSKISSARPAFRFKEAGHMFDVAGLCLFPSEEGSFLPLLGLCNSSVSASFFAFLSPTLNFEVGNVCSLPCVNLPLGKELSLSDLVAACIRCARGDYNSFESSWDFKRHPLV